MPEAFTFAGDGTFPNSRLPVLIYRAALSNDPDEVEAHLVRHNWSNCWRNGVYPYHHYHSTSHEVLVVYVGSARLCLGGPRLGQTVGLSAGDVLILPAGVAHQRVEASPDFAVLGAYAGGRDWDLLRGQPGERPAADERIARVPLPAQDPVEGPSGPLSKLWSGT